MLGVTITTSALCKSMPSMARFELIFISHSLSLRFIVGELCMLFSGHHFTCIIGHCWLCFPIVGCTLLHCKIIDIWVIVCANDGKCRYSKYARSIWVIVGHVCLSVSFLSIPYCLLLVIVGPVSLSFRKPQIKTNC